jgi:hypothetical protein
VWENLRNHPEPPQGEWLLHDGFLYAFHDLTFKPWTNACLSATAENLSTVDWASSDDNPKRYVFVRMLTICLKRLLYCQGIRYSEYKEHYFFRATQDFLERKVGGLSVFKAYASKTNTERIAYYRHRAMKAQFVCFEKQWYLEVTPSYHFTQNGSKLSRYFEERLKGIKMLERQNKTHLRQLRLWEEVLRQLHLGTTSVAQPLQRLLFNEPEAQSTLPVVKPYPYLSFDPLVEFQVDYGIPESAWLPTEDLLKETDDGDGSQARLFQ